MDHSGNFTRESFNGSLPLISPIPEDHEGHTSLRDFEEYENPEFNQTFIALDGEIVLMYLMGQMRMEKFSLANKMPSLDPAFC